MSVKSRESLLSSALWFISLRIHVCLACPRQGSPRLHTTLSKPPHTFVRSSATSTVKNDMFARLSYHIKTSGDVRLQRER
ncbi:hypothetical protein LZ30DRAFT_709660 [Colletotrichum cereale]|nr:hypothetical protein LZ30DRAFT_709660 [Colletotrichum cereale]